MDQTFKDASTSSGLHSSTYIQQPTQITLHNSNRLVSHLPGRSHVTATNTSPVSIPLSSSSMYNRFETLILSLTDSTKRDDIKYKDLREISENFEELLGSSSHASLIDSLIRAFIRVLQETQPQFISENNTLLRKLVLELLLKMSTNESIKCYSKAIQVLLLRITYTDNEENALIVIKILTDHIKAFRGQITGELSSFFSQWKNAYREMFRYASEERMFLSPDYFEANSRSIEDFLPMDALQFCFMTSVLSFENIQQPQNLKYSLIPRAAQSVRVLAEMSVFLLFLIQSHRQHCYGELMELIPLFVRYININVPKHLRQEKSYNKYLVDEFHNSQVRALTFIAYTTRHSQLLKLISDNSTAISNGIKQLFEGLHSDVIHQRRDLLLAIKHFFQCESKAKFISIIPRMLTDSLLIGNSFTSREQLRNQAYTLLADILHHVRMSLPRKILTHIYFVAIRNMHDPLLLPYVQTMYAKLMMNFIEPLLIYDKQNGKLAYNILLCAIDACVRKAEFLANYYLPLLRDKFRGTGNSVPTGATSTINSILSNNKGSNSNIFASKIAKTKTTTTQSSAFLNESKKNLGFTENLFTENNKDNNNKKSNLIKEFVENKKVDSSENVAPNHQLLKMNSYDCNVQEKSTFITEGIALVPFINQITMFSNHTPHAPDLIKKAVTIPDSFIQSWQDITPLSINDCKNMIRFIIQPIKMMVSALKEISNWDQDLLNSIVFTEAQLLSKFFFYGLKCLDIFIIGVNANNSYQKSTNSGIRSKEEKEAIDAFIGIYSNLDASIFYDIMNEHIEFFVERIFNNPALQSICSTILIHHPAAPKIGGILVKFLLKHLPEMGNNNERSVLYLKLFKLVFSAVSYTQVNPECENMLKPFLHDIVQESMQLALRSRESNNYFWLLRALFRSIGSGAHDLLYQQFLPLLPSILQQLNRLQNSSHRQSIHELFVELCLTVPVRLSSLLPYLPLLMDPLVCALYGSPTLVQQGLRTLELCVDNLQPEYFYDHMFPVRAALLQGLWQTVSTSDFQTSLSAFRILGKFGGSSRKVLLDAQSIDFDATASYDEDLNPASFSVFFYHSLNEKSFLTLNNYELNNKDNKMEVDNSNLSYINKEISEELKNNTKINSKSLFNCNIILQSLVEGAAFILRHPQNNDGTFNNIIGANTISHGGTGSEFPRLQALEIIKAVILSSIYSKKLLKLKPETLKVLFAKAAENAKKQFLVKEYCQEVMRLFYQHNSIIDKKARKLHSTALIGLFYAVMNNDLKEEVFPLFKDVIRYLTIHIILHFGNPEDSDVNTNLLLDAIVLVDAITTTLADSCKDFCHSVVAALKFIIDTATLVFGSDQVCELPFFNYLIEQISFLCYRKEWYARIGGCTALRFMTDNYPAFFVKKHAKIILDAFIEITFGLAEEVSCGALDFASESMDVFLPVCFSNSKPKNKEMQVDDKMVNLFLSRIIKHLGDPEILLRKECYRILNLISQLTNRTMAQLFLPFKLKINQILKTKMNDFIKLSSDCQLGFIIFYTFILEIKEFDIDVPTKVLDVFFKNLLIICDESQQNLFSKINFSFKETDKNELRFLAIHNAAIDLCVAYCLRNYTKNDEKLNKFEDCLPTLNQILQLFLENALSLNINSQLREKSTEAVKKIYFTNLCNNLFDNRLTKLINDITNFDSKDLLLILKNFIFLSEFSSIKCSLVQLQPLIDNIQIIFNKQLVEVSTKDVSCVINLIKLLCSLNLPFFDILKSCLFFFAVIDEKLHITNNSEWMGDFLKILSATSEHEITDFFIEQIISNDTSSTVFLNFIISFIKHKNGEKLCNNLKSRIDILSENLHLISKDKIITDKTVIEHMSALTPLNPINQNSKRLLRILQLIWTLIEVDLLWFTKQNALFNVIRDLWNNELFRNTFSVRIEFNDEDNVYQSAKLMEPTKYDVPVYCARIMLAYLRFLLFNKDATAASHIENDLFSIDVVFDLIYIFCFTYVTDFTFVRNFIDAELVPYVSLNWRRKAFKKVIDILISMEEDRRKTGTVQLCSDQLVRFMQFVILPSFHFSFEKFNADLVIGSTPDQEQRNDNDVMTVLLMYIKIICTQNRENNQTSGSNLNKLNRDNAHCMSDAMTIIMYQFCVLLVQNCPFHIHDMTKKQQHEGNRLRLFMLFGWPCLQANYSRDLTEKYAGHLLIANIIDKFAINRIIVLQVLNSLVMAYHQDHKDVVRKALDILIPAVPRRMDDGYIQLFTIIKKVILEESRSTTQVAVHCLNIVIRHHKVFYFVRHQLSHLLLSTLQLLLVSQYGFESRRLVIDICDTFVKWEQERQRIVGLSDSALVENNLSSNKSSNSQANLLEISDVLQSKSNADDNLTYRSTATEINTSVTNNPSGISAEIVISSAISKNGVAVDELHRPMDKVVIDNIIMLLLRITTSTPEIMSGGMTNTSIEAMSKKSVILLRSAMRPNIFGNVVTLKTQWFEKQLTLPNPEQITNEQTSNHQLAQVQLTLDTFSHIIMFMPQSLVCNIFCSLQRPLMYCLNCSTHQIVRSTYNVISKLFDKTETSSNGLIEFEMLNQSIAKYFHDSFLTYSNSHSNPNQLTFMSITLLRSICAIEPAYLETVCLNSFLRMLQRLVCDYQPSIIFYNSTQHFEPGQKFLSDVLCICLEMLCSRIFYLTYEAKKNISQLILSPLIEKTPIERVLESLIKIIHEFLLDGINGLLTGNVNLGTGLLIKVTLFLEGKLLSNSDLLRLFLESILIVFENEYFKDMTDILSKLSPAFFWGLCSRNSTIRFRCFDVLEKHYPLDIYNRMIYILCKQNWQCFGSYFWISHIIHLILLSKSPNSSNQKSSLVINEAYEKSFSSSNFFKITNIYTFSQFAENLITEFENKKILDAIDTSILNSNSFENIEILIEANTDKKIDYELNTATDNNLNKTELLSLDGTQNLINQNKKTISNVSIFDSYIRLLNLSNNIEYDKMIKNIIDYLHFDWNVAKNIFIKLFHSFWDQLDDVERSEIKLIAQPFMASTIMLPQKDALISVASTFLEAFVTCSPPIKFSSSLLKYIGETHNCWHFVIHLLENDAEHIRLANNPILKNTEFKEIEQLDVLNNLAYLYSKLNEFDQFWMVWKRKSYFDKTAKCLAFYNQGEFIQSRDLLEKSFNQLNEKLSQPLPNEFISISPALYSEVQLWEEYWINSCKELSDWSTLAEFSNNKDIANCGLLMESAWQLNEWSLLKECITQVDASGDPEFVIKTTLYKTMLSIINGDASNKNNIERLLLDANKFLINEWRKLPKVVSMCHVKLLVNAHFAHEINEASSTLQSVGNGSLVSVNNSVKHVMKSWRSRQLTQVDSLSSWINIFRWRFQHYNSIINEQTNNTFMLHSLAQSQLNLAVSLRHSGQLDMALNELNTLHTMPFILPMDAQFKIFEQIKCLIKLAEKNNINGNERRKSAKDLLHEALNVVNRTQVQFLKKDQISKIMLIKGIILSKLHRNDEAEHSFASSAVLEDLASGNTCSPIWKHWGRHLEALFLTNSTELNALNFGVQAITSYLECSKFASIVKSRRYLAKVFWLIKIISSCGDQCYESLEKVLNENVQYISPSNWIFWIDEIIADIKQRPSSYVFVNLLRFLTKSNSQQVFYALRNNLDTSLINENIKQLSDRMSTYKKWNIESSINNNENFKSDWKIKLLSVLEILFIRHPKNILCLNQILNDLDNFTPLPFEAVLYQLKDMLKECDNILYENISELLNIQLTADMQNKASKIVELLDISITEFETAHVISKNVSIALKLLKSLHKQLNNLLEENSIKILHNIASILRKCLSIIVEILRVETENRQNLLRNSSNVLSNFKNKMASIDIFSSSICPRIGTHAAQIAYFMPTFYTFVRQTGIRRLILIRSLNGKIYSYFLERVKSNSASNSIYQMFTMLNNEFTKDRAVCQRLMQFAIPRVLHISSKSRIMECCSTAGISSQFRSKHLISDPSDSIFTNNVANFLDIFDETLKNHLNNFEHNKDENNDWMKNSSSTSLQIVDTYYQRLIEHRHCHKTLLDIFNEFCQTNSSESKTKNIKYKQYFVPNNLLEKWISMKYSHPTNFWAVRKNLSVSFALMGYIEFVFFLSPMNLDELFLDLSNSQLFFSGYHFDLSKKYCKDSTGKCLTIELDGNRSVPFRMSPNISHFLNLSLEGHVSGALIAIARCLNNRSIDYLIRPIIWDVFHQTVFKEEIEDQDKLSNTQILNAVKPALNTILNRIGFNSSFCSAKSPTTGLLVSSQNADNLCRMDPTWHPWF